LPSLIEILATTVLGDDPVIQYIAQSQELQSSLDMHQFVMLCSDAIKKQTADDKAATDIHMFRCCMVIRRWLNEPFLFSTFEVFNDCDPVDRAGRIIGLWAVHLRWLGADIMRKKASL
jgi:hypothetical protein